MYTYKQTSIQERKVVMQHLKKGARGKKSKLGTQ